MSHDYQRRPDSEYRFFLNDPAWDGMMFFKTATERDAAAKESIDSYKDVVSGWSEDVESICIGEVTHVCAKTDVVERPPVHELDDDGIDASGRHWPSDIELFCNYEMQPIKAVAKNG